MPVPSTVGGRIAFFGGLWGSMQRIADEVGMNAKTANRYIAIGALNEWRADFYLRYDEDGEETGEDVSVDTISQPGKLHFREVLYAALYAPHRNYALPRQSSLTKSIEYPSPFSIWTSGIRKNVRSTSPTCKCSIYSLSFRMIIPRGSFSR